MFDSEIVVLVSNITSLNATAAVHSVLDSKVLRAHVLSSDGGPMAVGTSMSKPWWIHHDSVGYIIPENRNASAGSVTLHLDTTLGSVGQWADIGVSTTKASLPMFNAWLTRESPTVVGDALAYVVVPGVTTTNFDPVATLKAVKVVSNTAQLQAAYHKKLRLLSIVFWSSTEPLNLTPRGWRVSVDQPCVVLVQEVLRGTQLKITVSDPTQLLNVSVTIDRAMECINCVQSEDQMSTTLRISLAAGSSALVSATLADISNSAQPAASSASGVSCFATIIGALARLVHYLLCAASD
jgi:hypothetical protein